MAVDGKWNATMQTPQGAMPMTFDLVADGAKLTGKIEGGQMGSMDVSDGSVDGDNIAFKATLAQYGVSLEFKAKVDGDNMSGEVGFGQYGSGNFTATRA